MAPQETRTELLLLHREYGSISSGKVPDRGKVADPGTWQQGRPTCVSFNDY